MKDKTIVVGGNRYHVDCIVDILNDSQDWRVASGGQLSKGKLVYYVGGPGPRLWKHLFFWLFGPKKIIHWIGTDVLTFTNPKNAIYKAYYVFYRLVFLTGSCANRIKHVAGSQWLVQELSLAGIKAEYLPITTIDLEKLQTLERVHAKDIDFISYAPLNRFDFYGGYRILDQAEKMPHYNFVIVSTDLSDSSQIPKHIENVTFYPKMPFEDMQRLFMRSKCLLRFTKHDGLSLSVLEALYHRLRVFWTYPFPHTILAEDFASMPDKMTAIIDSWTPNDAGHDYVVNNFTVDKWKRDFQALLDTMI